MQDICSNLKRVREQIDKAAHRCRRDPSRIKLVAVSKTFPPEFVEMASACGQLAFGENRIQEAEEKIPEVRKRLAGGQIEWHLIGHLQSNKTRQATELFDVVQSVDSPKIARRLSRHCWESQRELPVFIQVNIGEEPQKHGVLPCLAASLVELAESVGRLTPVGLMAIPPYHEEAERSRCYFQRLARLLEEINRGRSRPLTELSMGMSGDFEIAIEEGATVVRIGSAIFGPRDSG